MKAGPPPPATLFASAARYHQAGRLDQAASAYRNVLRVAPDHVDALHLLALIEAQRGRLDAALPRLRQAARLAPARAEIRLNLANALMHAGRTNAALDAYRSAVKLRPGFREAQEALLRALRRIAAFLESENRAGESVPLWQEAITLAPADDTNWLGLARALETTVFIRHDPQLHDTLARALDHPAVDPDAIQFAVLSYLRLVPGFAEAMERPGLPQEIPGQALLCRLLERATVADPAIERTLTRWRAAALRASDLPLSPLLCAVAAQCFATEYAYAETAEEAARAEALASAIAAGGDVAPARLALLACYRPLHRLPGAAALAARPWPAPLDRIVRRQIAEPLEEQALRGTIPALTPIRDDVSQAVRRQYEENPYPRWHQVGRPAHAVQGRTEHAARRLDILIAGCGTGRHAVQTALRLPTARILAVDLSLASLAYAVRRTRELGLKGVEFAQADILELAATGRSFDLIESAGVLHHLRDPLAGWRVLSGLLRPGGAMLVALYSELARRPIVAARRFIADHNLADTSEGIREARQKILAEADESIVRRLRTNRDFYSLSGCRDLLFHVQEHRFTIPRIAAALDALGLEFAGFDPLDRTAAERFAARFPDDPQMRSLANWDAFEQDNPDTFATMYQFWARKRPSAEKGRP